MAYLGNVLQSQTFQEASLLRGQVWPDLLLLYLLLLCLLGLIRVGAALVEV